VRRAHGFTIFECLIAMTVLSFAVLATCYALAAGQQQVHDGDRTAAAVRLGTDLLEEIAARDYRDRGGTPVFGPEPDELTRAAFDDVDDYQNYSEAPGSLADATGTRYPAADEVFARNVTVTPETQSVPERGRSFTGLRVAVTVRAPGGEQWTFSRFIPEPGQ
jgi:prepilin-type N-terminal cleavage/methylation domain-containing protein